MFGLSETNISEKKSYSACDEICLAINHSCIQNMGITLKRTNKSTFLLELDQPIPTAATSTTISHWLRKANKGSHSLSIERRNCSGIYVRQRRTETRSTWVYAWQPSSWYVTTGCKHDAKGLLQRMRQANRRPSNHSFGQDMAPGAFHL